MRYKYQTIVRDGNGIVLSGATVSFYLAGTTTVANVYASATSTVAINSITSGSNGSFTIYFDALEYGTEQTYKIVYSMDGNYSSYTLDNIRPDDVILGTYTISTAKTIAHYVKIPKGVLFSKSGSGTMAFSGGFEAGLYQVFSGFSSGNITFSAGTVEKVFPELWGGTGDNATDNTTAITAAMAAARTAGLRYVDLQGGTYLYSALSIPYGIIPRGQGQKYTTITSTSTSTDAITLLSEGGVYFNGLQDLTLDASAARRAGAAHYGIYAATGSAATVYKIWLKNVTVQYQPGDGIYIVDPELGTFENVISQYNTGRGITITKFGTAASGYNNNFINFRAYQNTGQPINANTNGSTFWNTQALTGSGAYRGVMFAIAGRGNDIINSDVELNGNPSTVDILLCTGIVDSGDRTLIDGGFYGNLGIAIDLASRGTVIRNPNMRLYSTAVTVTLAGSIGIKVRATANTAIVQYNDIGETHYIETYVSNLASDTALITNAAITLGGMVFSGSGYVQGAEISDPAAPATNSGRLYFKDNGAGKTQLAVRFPTGSVQIIATEP